MSGEKWTPGPWFVATGCSWRRILQERTDEPVIVPAKSRHDGHPDLIGGDANLQLASAAPDLYEALKAMCEAYTDVLDGLNMTEDVTGRLGNAHRSGIDALLKARGDE